MIKTLISRKLDSAEKELGASVDYMRYILDHSLGAFLKFTKIMPLAAYRKKLPAAPYFVAQIAATRDADCGPCVQIGVNMGRKAGVSPAILLAAAEGRVDDLDPELADVYRFAEAVVRATGDEERLRSRMRERYGEEGLIEMAFTIAVSRVFPTTKRALGYATSCSKVKITA